MPVQSLPVRDASIHLRLLQQYLVLLKNYPILTKSVTSGILSALGNVLSQILEARKKIKSGAPVGEIDPGCSCSICNLWVLYHRSVKRLLLDRLIFAPGFLLMFYFVMNILEAKGWRDFESKMRGSYWTALKMNWKVWTPFQFVNINFVPVEFRVLFANMVALFWYAYLASVRK
ncbi:hypothetical protein CesoFtcFv8_004058 [Champsocephalus esox]|uniref:Peroxisomal membrane protein 2 n=2 Tax=Notothenioidei TaxID=8205 RepID=A0AAN8CXQ3_9TELE|nr:hypothetical protein CesoFtcFv8_004058 [Champsocephalus esox]